MWRRCRELNSDLKVRSLAPSSVGPHPTLEAAERFELSSSEVEARRIGPLCYAASLLTNSGAGCGNRTHFVSLKRRVHIPICQSRNLVGDAGIEPAWSRLRGECISHLCQSPTFNIRWCRMLESNQRLAVIDRGLDLRANPAWCAVRELNPHLLGVGQLFWSVELPARKIGRGCRS